VLLYSNVVILQHIVIIVDLRQDMLTLQLISVMDAIWKSAGLDLRYTIQAFYGILNRDFLFITSGLDFIIKDLPS